MAGGLHPNPGTNNIIIYHYFHRLMSQFPLPPPLAAPLPSRAAASLAAPGGETYRTPLYREISVFKRFRTPALSPAVSRYDPYFVKGESRYVVLILEFFWEKEKNLFTGWRVIRHRIFHLDFTLYVGKKAVAHCCSFDIRASHINAF